MGGSSHAGLVRGRSLLFTLSGRVPNSRRNHAAWPLVRAVAGRALPPQHVQVPRVGGARTSFGGRTAKYARIAAHFDIGRLMFCGVVRISHQGVDVGVEVGVASRGGGVLEGMRNAFLVDTALAVLDLAELYFPAFEKVQVLPELPIQGQLVPVSTCSCDADERDGIKIAENLEAYLRREVVDEVDIKAGLELFHNLGDDARGEVVEKGHRELYLAPSGSATRSESE